MADPMTCPDRKPIILAAAAGTGKTTIAHALVDGDERFVFSISATTRPPRGQERDGVDYHFVTEDRFREMVDGGELVEWARVHGNWYGTPHKSLAAAAEKGKHAVLEIDVQGARQVRRSIPTALLIFILPPSAEILVERLRGRGTEADEEVARRLENALEELQEARDFDYVVVNRDVDEVLAEIKEIIRVEPELTLSGEALSREVERLRSGIRGIMARLTKADEGPVKRADTGR